MHCASNHGLSWPYPCAGPSSQPTARTCRAPAVAAAEQCWIHSLGIDPDNLGVRERLAATLRSAGRLLEAAQVLHGMLPRLEGRAERCGVLLDLGGLIDEIAPIPGVGPEWVDPTSSLPASPRVRLGSGEAVEPLSAEACYRRAAEADPECGEAHKRLADVLVLVAGEAAALPSFERAAALMPDDVCCATHVYCGAPPPRARTALPLVETPEEPHATLATLTGRVPGCYGAMAASFELHGALVIPSLLSAADVDSLRAAVDAASDDARTLDFTSETRDAERREHKALPLAHARTAATLGAACRALWPVLAEALQVEAAGCVPLLGAGFMKVRPGAAAQRLHKDVHLHDRHGGVGRLAAGGAPRAMSVQLQLTDTTAERRMGALELLPGSHRPDGAHGRPDQVRMPLQVEPRGCCLRPAPRTLRRACADRARRSRCSRRTRDRASVRDSGRRHAVQLTPVALRRGK